MLLQVALLQVDLFKVTIAGNLLQVTILQTTLVIMIESMKLKRNENVLTKTEQDDS